MYMYLEEPYSEKECFDCGDKEKKIKEIKYWMQYLLEQCYSTDKFSIDNFERSLAEICFHVGLYLPENDPTITRKVLR